MKIYRKNTRRIYDNLKILSFDDNKNYSLCNYKNRFLNGDKLKNNSIPSVDMIFIHKKKKLICFVEFKNSTYDNLNSGKMKKKLKQKIFGSMILIAENLFLDIRDFKKIYFVIYDKTSNSYVEEFESLGDKERLIEFDLKELVEKNFINEVFTENCNFLKKFFENKFNIIFR